MLLKRLTISRSPASLVGWFSAVLEQYGSPHGGLSLPKPVKGAILPSKLPDLASVGSGIMKPQPLIAVRDVEGSPV